MRDVVPSAFVTKLKSKFRMATTIGENSQPALRPAGRNLNPLVANVFPPAFAIQKSFHFRTVAVSAGPAAARERL
jgi:hypothetical protein